MTPVVFRTLNTKNFQNTFLCIQSDQCFKHLNTLFSIVAADYNITIFPTAILHESGINGYKIYQKSDLKVETNVTKSAERQRYTYRVLQTIQMKLILLCVWAQRDDSVKLWQRPF